MKYTTDEVVRCEMKNEEAEVCEPEIVEELKEKRGFRHFMRKNGGKIVAVVWYGGMAALTIGGIIKGFKNQKQFENLIREKYGNDSVTEGIFAEGNMKKLWDGNREFEESYKGNFDKVVDFVKGLDMKADENYSISRVVDKGGKISTELVMTRDGGFYHGIQL